MGILYQCDMCGSTVKTPDLYTTIRVHRNYYRKGEKAFTFEFSACKGCTRKLLEMFGEKFPGDKPEQVE